MWQSDESVVVYEPTQRTSGAEILAWVASGELPLAITNEVLFIAAVFLVPAVFALYYSLAGTDYDIRVNTPAAAGLVIALFYGGLHATGIVLGVATIVLSLAMRRGVYGRNIAYLGFATGAFDIVGDN